MDADTLIKETKVAALLGCHRSTVWRLAGNGDLPTPTKIGGMSRWKLSEIQAVINGPAERTRRV